MKRKVDSRSSGTTLPLRARARPPSNRPLPGRSAEGQAPAVPAGPARRVPLTRHDCSRAGGPRRPVRRLARVQTASHELDRGAAKCMIRYSDQWPVGTAYSSSMKLQRMGASSSSACGDRSIDSGGGLHIDAVWVEEMDTSKGPADRAAHLPRAPTMSARRRFPPHIIIGPCRPPRAPACLPCRAPAAHGLLSCGRKPPRASYQELDMIRLGAASPVTSSRPRQECTLF